MRPTRTAQTLIAATVAITVLAGCGGEDPDPSAASGASSSETTSESTPAAETASAEPAPAGDVPAVCEAYEVLSWIDPAAKGPNQLRANLIAFTWATEKTAEAAPPELAEAAQVLVVRVPEYVAMAEAAGYKPTRKQVMAFFTADDVAAASQELDAFVERSCDT